MKGFRSFMISTVSICIVARLLYCLGMFPTQKSWRLEKGYKEHMVRINRLPKNGPFPNDISVNFRCRVCSNICQRCRWICLSCRVLPAKRLPSRNVRWLQSMWRAQLCVKIPPFVTMLSKVYQAQILILCFWVAWVGLWHIQNSKEQAQVTPV